MGRRPRKKLDKNIQSFIKDKFYSRSEFSDIFDDFFKDYKPKRTKPLTSIFDDFFENEQKALKTIKSWKPATNSAQAIKKVSENSQSLTQKAQREKHRQATNLGGGRVRKQKFKVSELAPLVSRFGERTKTGADGKTYHNVGDDKFLNYMYDNELKTPYDIIKAHGKQKKKFNLAEDDWETLTVILRSINMTPQYEKNSKLAINNFIKIYRKHLKTKQPLKVFAVSKPFKDWCIEEDLYFNSDENLRQNIKLMVVAWNKDNPKDKLPLKIK